MAENSFDVRAGTATLPAPGDAVAARASQRGYSCQTDGHALDLQRFQEQPNLWVIWFRCPVCTAGWVSTLLPDGTLAPWFAAPGV